MLTLMQAVGLFAATNIDDVIVLALFFARGRGQAGTFRRILIGQYLGFAAILVAALLAAWGAGVLLPPSVIPFFGLVPLAIGLQAGWEAWRGEDDDELDTRARVTVPTVAAITFANGGDNIGVYVPVFLHVSPAAVAIYCGVFLVLLAGLVWLARCAATRPGISEVLERFEHILFPLVMIVLGLVILVGGLLGG